MATIKKFDFSGKEIEEVNIEDEFLQDSVNAQMIKDYLVAIRKNARQNSANTKGRKEVTCTGAKPHRQKGLGRARQGSLAAPQYRGGGIVFGPKPKFDQHVKINKKEKQLSIRYLLSEKIKNSNAIVLKLDDKKVAKTKEVYSFFEKLEFNNSRILIISNEDNTNFKRCVKNIQKTQFVQISNLNGYNLALSTKVILMESALENFKNIMKAGKVAKNG